MSSNCGAADVPLSNSHAAALDYAKEQWAWFRDNDVDVLGKPVRFLDPASSEAYAAHTLACCLVSGIIEPAHALERAKAGDPLFLDALSLLGGMSVAGTINLPSELRAAVTAALIEPIRARRARRLESNFFRDVCLTMIVQEVSERFGLPTTGRSARRSNACKIVAEATGLEYETVRKAVQKMIKQI